MTKEDALREATQIVNQKNIVMVVCNDPISNNVEDEPDGPWGYCPNGSQHLLFRWAVETIIIRPNLTKIEPLVYFG